MNKSLKFDGKTHLKETNLSNRVVNSLLRAKIETVDELYRIVNGGKFKYEYIHRYGNSINAKKIITSEVSGQKGLLRLKNFGIKSLKEVIKFCNLHEEKKNCPQCVVDGWIRYLRKLGYVVYKSKVKI